MLAIIASLFLLSISGFIVTGFLLAKKQNSSLVIVAIILSVTIFSTAIILKERYSYRIEMQRRLNEPICYLDQLYGYKVLDKRYTAEKPSFEKPVATNYFIDLEDLLPRGGTVSGTVIRSVRVSEKIYNDPTVEKGKEFLQ